jgi:hypothetical protein
MQRAIDCIAHRFPKAAGDGSFQTCEAASGRRIRVPRHHVPTRFPAISAEREFDCARCDMATDDARSTRFHHPKSHALGPDVGKIGRFTGLLAVCRGARIAPPKLWHVN